MRGLEDHFVLIILVSSFSLTDLTARAVLPPFHHALNQRPKVWQACSYDSKTNLNCDEHVDCRTEIRSLFLPPHDEWNLHKGHAANDDTQCKHSNQSASLPHPHLAQGKHERYRKNEDAQISDTVANCGGVAVNS